MNITNLVQHKMDISDSNPTSKPSANKVRIVMIEELNFCTAFVGRVPGNNIYGLMKGDNGFCNNYKTHVDKERGNVESTFYLNPTGTHLFLKPLVSLIAGDSNQEFL